jgi:hypothetical protein
MIQQDCAQLPSRNVKRRGELKRSEYTPIRLPN